MFNIYDYEQGAFIGKGSYAYCKIATHKYTGEEVVFKFYEKYRLQSIYRKRNLNKEIHVLSHTKHPNIIKLYTTIDTGK